MIKVEVPLGDGRSYDVLVGRGARHDLAALLPAGVRRIAVVTQPGVPALGDGLTTGLGVAVSTFTIGVGEEAKSLTTVEALCRQFVGAGLTRNDCVVAVGGGLVTDVGGFAAAVYHRGIAVVHVATTLLGMVDAAIGGKTGVNLPEGKNLVGAFWQPAGVVCDLELLDSLPAREWRSGTGEIAKYHFLTDDDLLALPLEERVARCVEIKAAVVAADERESGGRALLNYGHTLAHALEVGGSFDLRHGEAVAVGIGYAAALARTLGRIDDARVAEHHRVLAAYELDARPPAGASWATLVELMARDKKALDGFTFVLDGPNGVELVAGVERAALDEAWERVSRG